MSDIETLAALYGFEADYIAADGQHLRSPPEGLQALISALGEVPSGDSDPAAEDARRLSCFVPAFLWENRVWGVTCQIYGLRSRRNWGIGDFDDLAELARIVGRHGGDFIGISPVHALFADEPWRCSPYGPSSKRFLNTLHIAPDIEPEFRLVAQPSPVQLEQVRGSDLVDYGEVAALKDRVLRDMHDAFRLSADGERHAAFAAFRQRRGAALETFALFEALCVHFRRQAGRSVPWQDWPDDFRSPDGSGAVAFRNEQSVEVDYRAWLQWLAEGQMARAQQAALSAGMRIGIYVDLAVGVVGDSAETWMDPGATVNGATIGAPADGLNPRGQNWQLAPLSPTALRSRHFRPLRDELDASMAHAGAVRLDHAMGLTRLFWIPRGMSPREGAYMRYPFADMLATVAQASHEHRTLVIAEALGTVPPGFREQLAASDIHAYQVLFFERHHDGGFVPPAHYNAAGLACVSTHDLPTLRGWWRGHDIHWRQQLELFSPEEADAERLARERDRQALSEAMIRDGVGGVSADDRDLDATQIIAVHRFVARGTSRLLAVQMEDALGLIDQANLPGETAPHPNWRRKLPVMLEDLEHHSRFPAMMLAMAEERPRR